MVKKFAIDEMMKLAREEWLSHRKSAPETMHHFDLAVDAQVAFLKWFMTEANDIPLDDDGGHLFHHAASVVLTSMVAAISSVSRSDPKVQGLAGSYFMSALHQGMLSFMKGEVPSDAAHLVKAPTKDLGDA